MNSSKWSFCFHKSPQIQKSYDTERQVKTENKKERWCVEKQILCENNGNP